MSELATIAKNLARNCGYHVFPCSLERKMPCWSKKDGGRGFHDATTEPVEIDRLFAHPHAGLIGVRTGEASGVSVLDIDVKHDTARAWWIKNERRLPTTRTYRTRSGGLHLYFRHARGVRNSEGVPIKGVDTRGEGGYVAFWFANGFECLDHSPPAPWPPSLTRLFWPLPETKALHASVGSGAACSDAQLERVRDRAIKRVMDASEGARHHSIRSSARLLGGIQQRANFTDEQATTWLLEAAGLEAERKARATVAWGLARGRNEPLRLGGGR